MRLEIGRLVLGEIGRLVLEVVVSEGWLLVVGRLERLLGGFGRLAVGCIGYLLIVIGRLVGLGKTLECCFGSTGNGMIGTFVGRFGRLAVGCMDIRLIGTGRLVVGKV